MVSEISRITIKQAVEGVDISISLCHAIVSDVLGMKFVAEKINFKQMPHPISIAQDLLNEINCDPSLLKKVLQKGYETCSIKVCSAIAIAILSKSNIPLESLRTY